MSSFLKRLVLACALLNTAVQAHPKPALHKAIFRPPWHGKRQAAQANDCQITTPAAAVVAPKENIWHGLTNSEVIGLLGWLYDPQQGLNLTKDEDAGAWDNTVGVTELLTPNKTDALAYIVGDGPVPARYARVGLFIGATEEPYMQNFMVGPLGPSGPTEQTTIQPLDFIYSKGTGKMPNYGADAGSVRELQTNVTASIADITMDLLGIVSADHERKTCLCKG